MSTRVRRGRSLRSRLLAYITDAVDRLRRLVHPHHRPDPPPERARRDPSRPHLGRRPRILRAAIAAFNTSLGAFNRAAMAFAERWAATDLPLIYREGAWTMLDNADRRQSTFTWTDRHRPPSPRHPPSTTPTSPPASARPCAAPAPSCAPPRTPPETPCRPHRHRAAAPRTPPRHRHLRQQRPPPRSTRGPARPSPGRPSPPPTRRPPAPPWTNSAPSSSRSAMGPNA
jgi:hypothetical protein